MSANTENIQNGIISTPDFSQEAMDQIAKTVKLKNCDLKLIEKFGKGDNFLGVLYKAIVKGENKIGANEEHKVIVKFSLRDEAVRQLFHLNILYSREAFMYNTFLPAIDQFQKERNVPEWEQFKFAQCLATDTRELSEVLVFEDLNEKSFVMHDRLQPLDFNHTMIVIKNLAKYHALSYAVKDRMPEIYKQAEEFKFHPLDFGDDFLKHLEKNTDTAASNIEDSEHKERFTKFGKNISKEFMDSLDIDNDDCPYNVLCHGDSWNNNFLFKYQESKPVEVIMLDWQIAKYASPITDIAYFIYTGTDKDFRDKHLKEVYELYYSTLKEYLGKLDVDVDKCYPEHVFRQQIKQKSVTGLIWAFLILPVSLENRENSKDLNDFVNEVDNINDYTVIYSDLAKRRFNEVVHDFVEMGII